MATIQTQKFVHYYNIDIAKVVFAVFVVAIHTLAPFTATLSTEAQRVTTALLSMAVPFFFVASGFLLGNKLSSINREGQQGYLRKWLYRIGRLYLLWTLIYLPYAIYGFSLDGISIGKSIILYTRNILLIGENYWSWPLWYLLGMLVSGCIIWLLNRLNIKRTYWYGLAILLAIIGILLDELHTHNWGGGKPLLFYI